LATKRKKKRSARPTKAQLQARTQFLAICLLTLGLLFFFLAVVEGSEGWQTMHNVLLGLFGCSAFFIGPLFVYISVMASFEKLSEGLKIRAALTLIFLCILCAAFQIFLAGRPVTGVVKTLYLDGQALQGGGVMALVFGIPLMMLGSPGDKIVVCLLLFLLLMISTRSTIAGVLRGARKPVDKVVEGYHELSDSIAAKQEARKSENQKLEMPWLLTSASIFTPALHSGHSREGWL